MSPDWFSGIPAASATVECGSEAHEVAWRDGRFSPVAHTDDLEGERALAALAGGPCRCIQLLDAWERHAADPLVLLLGPRGDEELNPGGRRRLRGTPLLGFTSHGGLPPNSVGDDEPEDALETLLSLEGEIPRRLVATVAAALWEQDDRGLATTLQAALYGRLLASVQRWWFPSPELELARLTSHPDGADPELELLVSNGEHSLVRHSDGRLTARLPISWITEVWAGRLDVIDGELSLAARRSVSGRLELVTVDHAMTMHTRTLPAS